MILTLNLLVARVMTSGEARAPLAGFVLSVIMIIYGESLLPFADSGGENFYDRFGELFMAALWSIGALSILTTWFPPRPAESTEGN